MIYWMLTQLERNPAATFYERDLVTRFADAFEQAKTGRLLGRLPYPSFDNAPTLYHRGLSHSHVVVPRNDGVLEAFDPEDPEAEPIELSPNDLVQWTVDRDRLAMKYQEVNGLTGRPEALSDRLHFLGEAGEGGARVAFVLALLRDPRLARLSLSALPSLLPQSYHLVGVACPLFMPPPTELAWLAKLRIILFSLDPERALTLPTTEQLSMLCDQGPSAAEFRPSSDYRSVRWRGQQFSFTPQRAAVIKMLHQAHRTGTPDLSWGQIRERLENLESYPERMSDVFKKSPAWRTLVIKGGTRGTYRLNL